MKLILVELNEINFDIVRGYIDKGANLDSLSYIIKNGLQDTQAESEYQLLEPWIQWPSVHTGLSFNEHKTFRLGDFVNSNKKQFFELIENAGYSVGAISPMNATNKLLYPAYFISDPWTDTKSDKSFLSKNLSEAISQAVNDNSKSRITLKTILVLILSFLVIVKPKNYYKLIKYAFSAFYKPWRKALFLDLFIHEIHKELHSRKNPNFSTIFFNAGAHIQHHYFFNSSEVKSDELMNPEWYMSSMNDPILDMLKLYDRVLGEYLSMSEVDLIIATGLSQKPYNKLKFYYRLDDHENFLNMLNIKFNRVEPRMTRDFLISFESSEDALKCENILKSIFVDNQIRLFNEIDNRGNDIFVVLTYPHEIKDETYVFIGDRKIFLKENTNFVAIKNGEHQSKGYAYYSKNLTKLKPENNSHVKSINKVVLDYFNVSQT
jgi:hypothetical protein